DFTGLVGTPPVVAVPGPIKACSDKSVNLRLVEVGFKCLTSKGVKYERVARDGFGEAWKGPDGLIWSDFVGVYSQGFAKLTCRFDLGANLPDLSAFVRGEANGFREVLPNMIDRAYWSASELDFPGLYSYWFDGSSGYPEHGYSYLHSWARCVAR
ncbi:hypothetical protein WDW37_11630, partial [Bdellovibrionota bacterium FG-1]